VVQQLSTNNFGPAKWVVNPIAYLGTHTTISAAIASASSGDTIFIMPGTYTENPTLKPGVNLTAYNCDSANDIIFNESVHVTINGTCTLSSAGTVSCSGIGFQTNGSYAIVVSGAGICHLNLFSCYFGFTNNTGISFTNSNAQSVISIYYGSGNTNTTGIALFEHSAAGNLEIFYSRFNNTGMSSTANTVSGGIFQIYYSILLSPTAVSGGFMLVGFCDINSGDTNSTCITFTNSSPNALYSCQLNSGTATALVITSPAVVTITGGCQILSNASSTYAITGTGTINYGATTVTGSANMLDPGLTAVTAPLLT
jgi:hypothetical protein